jgi:hypothetical protein
LRDNAATACLLVAYALLVWLSLPSSSFMVTGSSLVYR